MSRSRSVSRSRSPVRERSRSPVRDRSPANRGGGGFRDGGKSKSSTLFSVRVNNLAYNSREEDLRRKFDKFGEIGDLFMPMDRDSGRSRGFCFVRYYKKDDMLDAVEEYRNGFEMDGRTTRVEEAGERPEPGSSNWDPKFKDKQRDFERNNGGGRGGDRGGDRGGRGRDDYYRNDRRSPPRRGGYDDRRRSPPRYDDRRGGHDDRRRSPPRDDRRRSPPRGGRSPPRDYYRR